MDRKSLEWLLAQGLSVEKIAKRFAKHPSTVSYWMDKYGLKALGRKKHAAKGGIARDELERMILAGMTIAEIAEQVGLSKGTVRHWLGRYGLKTLNGRGPRTPNNTTAPKAAGLLTAIMQCAEHGNTEFVIEGRGYYRCKRCRADRVARRRRSIKAILVQEAGGQCAICVI